MHIPDLFERIQAGDVRAVSRGITLIESTQAAHQDMALDLLDLCLTASGGAHRIGITGLPGAGKSTFIESAGLLLVNEGLRVSVLSVDPTSRKTGGSILGDKTRMEQLGRSEQAFIRPSPSGFTPGGVAARTYEAMLICEASGFDVIMVETVGIGQSEDLVRQMVDTLVLLALTGAGDGLQGIKKGVIEFADFILINKADGTNVDPAQALKKTLTQSLAYFSSTPPVVQCISAQHGDGLPDVLNQIRALYEALRSTGQLQKNRVAQHQNWFYACVEQAFHAFLYSEEARTPALESILKAITAGRLSPRRAAAQFLSAFTRGDQPL